MFNLAQILIKKNIKMMYFCKICNMYFYLVFLSEKYKSQNRIKYCLLCSSINSIVKIYSYREMGFNIKKQDLYLQPPLICDYGRYDVIYFVY